MKFIEIRCAFCRNIFKRSRRQSNEAKKFGWRQFCSIKYMAASRLNGKKLACANKECAEIFYRPLKEIKKIQNSFCSHTCSAIVNNKQRGENRPKIYCAYQSCKLPIPRDQKYCSRAHNGLTHRVSKEEFEKKFIERIKTFYKKHKRVPVKREREMYGAYREARVFYGSWNNAITAAGFKPNPILFAEKYIANDGHHCESLAEKIIDDWLSEKNMGHERNKKYPGNPKLTVDFLADHHWIEFLALVEN